MFVKKERRVRARKQEWSWIYQNHTKRKDHLTKKIRGGKEK
jgi:hypothetical protein